MRRRAVLSSIAFSLAVIAAGDPTAFSPRPIPHDVLPDTLPIARPFGLPPLADPHDATEADRVALGRRVFFDGILSRDRSVACASCHDPAHGFARPEALAIGIDGKVGERNAPTLLNRALGRRFTWDGRFESLAQQALDPIANPIEMDLAVDDAVARLAADARYAEEFSHAFGGPPTRERLGAALESFERRLVIGDSPIDRFRASSVYSALTESERAGVWTYESKGKCWRCHSGPNFSDEEFHNTGAGDAAHAADLGRAKVTRDAADTGKWKTPTLRGLAFTAPYMHDGSLATLMDVVEFYARGGGKNAHLDPRIEPIDFTEQEKRDLVAFLEALSKSAADAGGAGAGETKR